MYSKEELLNGLRTNVVGSKVFVFESIDSTNTCAKTLAETGMEEGAVVVSDYQTEGKGRFGRSWLSEPGKNLLFSTILRPRLHKEQAGLLTFYAAVSVARALEAVSKLRVECKWPNDLLVNGKKCCGILLENSFGKDRLDHSVVGVGINVNQRDFPDNGLSNATSLARELGKDIDRKKLFQTILRELDLLYSDVLNGSFSRIVLEWNNRCTMFGHEVRIIREGTTVYGTAIGLHTDGGLVVETSRGKEIVYAGDVSVLS
ncbi:MAG: biotin--[acetyl-CoA-carboxylase] ligase [Bacteroidota bacterium]